jgi:SNF2 family DNA or RNA helicase
MADDRPQAQVSLEGGEVRVSGSDLESARLSLFFRTILGCRRDGDAWVCPTRGSPGNDLLIRIAGQLNRRGYAVAASGQDADLALKHEIERLRSFERARDAARDYLQLPGAGSGDGLSEANVLQTLEEAGWNNDARPLLPHQRQGLLHALTAVNAANFSVPGAGKTATALAVIGTHLAHQHIDGVVVVGPLSCFRPWEHEADAALPGVLDVRRVRNLSRPARTDLYRRVRHGDLLLLSFATAATDRLELAQLCSRMQIMLIVDESHRVKRFRGGQWAPALVEVARYARVKLILTGTPMPQGPNDLWTQFNILWPGEEATGSRINYRARAEGDFDGVIRSLEPFFRRGAWPARAASNFATVIGELQPFFMRTPKAELGLTPAAFFEHEVSMPPIQRDIYDLIVHRLRGAIPDAASWQDKIDALRRARPIRLIQAASNPDLLNEADGFFEIPPLSLPSSTLMDRLHRYRELGELPAKLEWALRFLADLQRDRRKCVVWTSFIRNIDQFSELVRRQLDAPVYSVDGRVPAADTTDDAASDELDETREQRIDQFLAEDGFAVLVANPAACAESISLHSSCFVAVYLDRTHDCARWLQSIDRIHRLGLPPDMTVEIHVVKATADGAPTIDDLVGRSLTAKRDRMQALLEDAELRGTGLDNQDTLHAAEGSPEDLDILLRYLLGEE